MPVALMNHPHITVDLLGYPVLAGSRSEIIAELISRIEAGRQTQVLTLNPEIIMRARSCTAIRSLLDTADLVVADGIGIELAARLLGIRGVRRYPGVDLAYDMLSALPGRITFLIGSLPGVADAAAAALKLRLPQANIAGCRDGYFGPDRDAEVAAQVSQAGTEILFVGMGSPRQEQFINSARHACGAKLMIGVGGSFEVYAGIKQRAPLWIRMLGLEWLHRITQDRQRLGRLACLPGFVKLVMREYIGKLNDQVC
jgi:N-acetylglucosaminyldiphosphoundecaprenol N-acetyl-beta-D-mannosaminyltransferase